MCLYLDGEFWIESRPSPLVPYSPPATKTAPAATTQPAAKTPRPADKTPPSGSPTPLLQLLLILFLLIKSLLLVLEAPLLQLLFRRKNIKETEPPKLGQNFMQILKINYLKVTAK